MSQIDEIIQICQSVFEGNQSMDESIIYEIHELALEVKSDRDKAESMENEKRLVEDVEEFFNEEDGSVGLYAVGWIDKEIVSEFTEAFDGVEIVSYNKDELEFKIKNDMYKVCNSSSYERWRLYKVV